MSHCKFDAVVFDCDGTLSSLEGIVELAKWNDVESVVAELTEQAMGQTGMTMGVYQQRIDMTRPSLQQCEDLADAYYQQRTPGLDQVLSECRDRSLAVFVISAGVNPSVQSFAKKLGIKAEHVYAVDLQFDEAGHYMDFDRTSPMTASGGKRQVVERIKLDYPSLLYVGDGKNDLDVYDDVAQFVGYGGAYYRSSIESVCEHYITEPSFLPLLPFLKA